MHKKNSTTHLKMILVDVLKIAFDHMRGLGIQLKDMGLDDANIKSKTPDEIRSAETMSHMLTIINDIIHPAHDICQDLFDKNMKDFVEFCKTNQAKAIEKKLLSAQCACYSCNSKGVSDAK